MESYHLYQDIKVAGLEVTTFPDGIKEAFDSLIKMLPAGEGRSCFGLSKMNDNGGIIYIAAIEQKENGELKKNHCKDYIIQKGEYITRELTNWMDKLCSIKDIFTELIEDDRTDKTSYCIEWYKDDKHMTCMLKKIPGA